ncbi:MAG: gloB [Gammaproteobacteria bacterium]|jgi:hydroxyacylglutathione hydrolase|nr:gloB [Gammaproteobacteria bacterium]
MNTITYIKALKDNYIWVIHSGGKAIIVDPGEAKPVLDYLKEHELSLSAILLTHHHWDHTNGTSELVEAYAPQVFSYSKATHHHTTHELAAENHIFLHTLNIKFAILKTPGHTMDAVCYFDGSNLFCGDTLFAAGCGRLFEGTAEQMFNTLNQLYELPEYTKVYCGHEYTLANLMFALELEPENMEVKSRINATQALLARHQSSLPSTIGLEKLTNPYFRCKDPVFAKRIAKRFDCDANDPLQVFTAIRQFKDNWSLK